MYVSFFFKKAEVSPVWLDNVASDELTRVLMGGKKNCNKFLHIGMETYSVVA